MSWNDYYLRRNVMDAVLEHSERNPGGALPFERIPHAAELFGSEEQLLLALYYRWTQVLGGYLRAAEAGPEDADLAPGAGEPDYADRVAAAWRTAAREHATLRAVLDANIDRFPDTLVPALKREQRMLALTAGLAEAYEPVDQITRVGATLMALTRHGGTQPGRRSTPLGQLLRLLQPTA